MGLRFRKSIKMGPARINFSKSGIGYSVGGKGFRATKKAGGGYRATASIPGTGISYVKDYPEKSKITDTGGDTMSKKSSGGKKPGKGKLILGAFIALCVVGAIAGGGGEKEESLPDTSVQAAASVAATSASTSAQLPGGAELPDTSELPEPEPVADPEPVAEPEPVADPKPVAEPDPVAEPEPVKVPDPAPADQPEESSESSNQPTEKPTEPSDQQTEQPAAQEPEPKPVSMAYIGNSNTNKFHKPSCSSVKEMSEEHKVSLDSRDSAISQGFVPCGRCKP